MDVKIEKQIAKALKNEDVTALDAALAAIEPEYHSASATRAEAARQHAEAEAQFQQLARQAALVTDGGEKALLEGQKAELKTGIIEAAENLSIASQRHEQVAATRNRLMQRKAELQRQARKRHVDELLRQAQDRLVTLQTSFPLAVNEIQTLLAQAEHLSAGDVPDDVALRTPLTTIENLLEAVGKLTIGDKLPNFDEQLHIRVLRYWDGHRPGATFTTTRRNVHEGLFRGAVEVIQH